MQKTPVYSQVNYLSDSICVDDIDKFCLPTYIDKVDIKDHSFDRRDKKKTQQILQTISHWWAPPKGVQCIRKLYKTNEMSFTMCERMGYAERDTTT